MRRRRQFTSEFKPEAVRLVERGDVPVAQVARNLGLHETVLRRWMAHFGTRAEGPRLTPEEGAGGTLLRRENKRFTLERNILKKAVGIFSKELP